VNAIEIPQHSPNHRLIGTVQHEHARKRSYVLAPRLTFKRDPPSQEEYIGLPDHVPMERFCLGGYGEE
jgi:hypothetical protein